MQSVHVIVMIDAHSSIMRLWFAGDTWRYINMFWLIDNWFISWCPHFVIFHSTEINPRRHTVVSVHAMTSPGPVLALSVAGDNGTWHRPVYTRDRVYQRRLVYWYTSVLHECCYRQFDSICAVSAGCPCPVALSVDSTNWHARRKVDIKNQWSNFRVFKKPGTRRVLKRVSEYPFQQFTLRMQILLCSTTLRWYNGPNE